MAVQDAQEKFISAEDLWELSQLPEYADKILELTEGVIVEMSRPGGTHGEVALRVGAAVLQHVDTHRLGYVTVETGYIVGKKPNGRDTVRGPDVAFVKSERAPDGLPDGYVPFAPDLAVEVVSPNDLAHEVEEKILDLLKSGTKLIWVFYPVTRNVIERRPGGKSAVYDEHDTLDGGDILPGFRLLVGSVFPAKKSGSTASEAE